MPLNQKEESTRTSLTEHELVALVNQAKSNSVSENTDYSSVNEKLLNQYLSKPYGDEVDGQSQVVTTDISDVVESDITSLVRVFLGASNMVEFIPLSSSPEDIAEAQEKSEYINFLIRNQQDAFKTFHDWMKSALIQKCSVIKYFIDKCVDVEEFTYSGVNEDELGAIEESLEGEDVAKLEVVSRTEDEEQEIDDVVREQIIQFIVATAAQQGQAIDPSQVLPEQIEDAITQLEAQGQRIRPLPIFDVTFKVIRERQVVKIAGIPTEDFIISEDASSKHDAELVGDKVRKTRGQLLAEGFDRELIDGLPAIGGDNDDNRNGMGRIRKREAFGNSAHSDVDSSVNDWASQEVEIYDLYMKVDFDQDGYAERRHIMMSGNRILVNEIFNHVPYAILSSILMPYEVVGRARAELAQTPQRVKTVVTRQMLDNLYMSNNSRIAANENVDIDDLLNPVPNGVIRVEGDNPINNDIIPVNTAFTGDKSLLILQHMDNARANSTGNFIANQGLDKDAVSKETATRFEGVKESGEAKVELVSRVYAETGFKDLFEGLAWLVAQYQDDETEIMVLGKPLTVNPALWKHHFITQPKIVDEGKMMESLQTILAIQTQAMQQGLPVTDQTKMFNTLDMMTKGLGIADATKFFNDPSQPDQLLQVQNNQLQGMVQQLQAALEQAQNPLAESEKIRAQANLIEAQGKQQTDLAKLEENARQFNVKTAQAQQQFEEKMRHEQEKFLETLTSKLTELELKFNKDIDGSRV